MVTNSLFYQLKNLIAVEVLKVLHFLIFFPSSNNHLLDSIGRCFKGPVLLLKMKIIQYCSFCFIEVEKNLFSLN